MESNFLAKIQPINTKEKVHAVVQAYKDGKFRSSSTYQFIIDISLLIRKVNLQILFREEMACLTESNNQAFHRQAKHRTQGNTSRVKIAHLSNQPRSCSLKEKRNPKDTRQGSSHSSRESKRIKRERNNERKYEVKLNNAMNKKQRFLAKNSSTRYFSPKNIVGKSFEEVSSSLKISKNELAEVLAKNEIDFDKIFTKKDYDILKQDINSIIVGKIDGIIAAANHSKPKFILLHEQKNKPSLGKPGNYFKLVFYGPKT